MSGMLSRVTMPRMLAQVRHVAPVRPGAASSLVADVYTQVERDFGILAPPVILHSPAPRTMAACWMMLRESLLASGLVSRAVKEAVATAVSLGNSCPYCVDVHTATLRSLVRGRYATEIAEERIETITDPVVRRTAAWARASGTRQDAARHPLVLAATAPELVGVAVTFQYLNRMANVFLGASPLPSQAPEGARPALLRLLGRLMRPAASRPAAPGGSLGLLPGAPLPVDLSWAEGTPHIADAFARAAAVMEEGGRRSVPESVRDLVAHRLAQWNGEPTGLSRAWVGEAVSGLRAEQRPAGRLALLTAMASHQVDESVVDAFRRLEPGDMELVELVSWAGFTAARHVGGWAWTPSPLARTPSPLARTSSPLLEREPRIS